MHVPLWKTPLGTGEECAFYSQHRALQGSPWLNFLAYAWDKSPHFMSLSHVQGEDRHEVPTAALHSHQVTLTPHLCVWQEQAAFEKHSQGTRDEPLLICTGWSLGILPTLM